MLQDYLKGPPDEIEAQLVAPLAFARAAKLATPTLDIVLPLAAHKAMSKGTVPPVRLTRAFARRRAGKMLTGFWKPLAQTGHFSRPWARPRG
jgi:hypothetical protein